MFRGVRQHLTLSSDSFTKSFTERMLRRMTITCTMSCESIFDMLLFTYKFPVLCNDTVTTLCIEYTPCHEIRFLMRNACGSIIIMHMHAYMRACMHACMHASLHACMLACILACMHACMHPSIIKYNKIQHLYSAIFTSALWRCTLLLQLLK